MNKLLRKITSVRIPDFQSVSLRQKALRCLAGFMFLMILLTLLSRAARSMTIAEAVLASPQKMTIDYNITANGRTVQDQETALSTLPNVKVKQVHVREGESVKAGDPLFTLDTEDLSAQILALNQEIEKMKLQAQRLLPTIGWIRKIRKTASHAPERITTQQKKRQTSSYSRRSRPWTKPARR